MWKIGIADDHTMFRKGLIEIINGFDGFTVTLEASNGDELKQVLHEGNLPDILILDLKMPLLNGFETAQWLRENYPDLKFIAVTMVEAEIPILKMVRLGARGYILKDSDTPELHKALIAVVNDGYHINEIMNWKVIRDLNIAFPESNKSKQINLTEKEIEFLKLAASELTYKEIADQMKIGVRTVDNYRDILFAKLNLKSRVGLVLYAIKNGFVHI